MGKTYFPVCASQDANFVLMNNFQMLTSKSVSVIIERCSNTTSDIECATEEEIEEFIPTINIGLSSFIEIFDSTKRDGKPVFIQEKYIDNIPLESKYL